MHCIVPLLVPVCPKHTTLAVLASWGSIGLAAASLQPAGLGHSDPILLRCASVQLIISTRPMAHLMHAIQAIAGRQ